MLVLLLVLLIMRVLCHFFACKSHYFRQAFMFTLTHSPRGIRTFMQTDDREGANNQAVGRTEWRESQVEQSRGKLPLATVFYNYCCRFVLLFHFFFLFSFCFSPRCLCTGFVSCLLRNIIVVYFVALFASPPLASNLCVCLSLSLCG